jgi:hypothetical protein
MELSQNISQSTKEVQGVLRPAVAQVEISLFSIDHIDAALVALYSVRFKFLVANTKKAFEDKVSGQPCRSVSLEWILACDRCKHG